MAAAAVRPPDPGLRRLLAPTGPVAAFLARRIDRPVEAAIRHLALPGLFRIPARVKRGKSFLTSMWARLPWRAAFGTLARATGTAAGACFVLANLLWAIGDLAIGALDAEPEPEPGAAPAPAALSG